VTELSDASSLSRAEAILRTACGERVRTGFSLAPLTTFRIGGPAALYLEPQAEPDLVAVAHAASETGVPVVVIGKGSNLLVADEGFPGIVLRLGRGYRWAARAGERVTAGGAMPLPALAGVALSHGLAGLEFGVAIPATLGGAVRMNAGAHGREMARALEWIELFDLDANRPERITRDEAGFVYRGSGLPVRGVVVGATARLVPDAQDAIRMRMEQAREWRRRTQPLAEPNCGSVFKNPPGGHAARLIEEAGAKALRVGGASVSSKHANFIVAGRDASAGDVMTLIRDVQDMVAARFDVRLDTEVQLVGNFDRDG
jgi:UDP-N-acetylmuramate dehydrogenase